MTRSECQTGPQLGDSAVNSDPDARLKMLNKSGVYKTMCDPSHRAMLFMLELLIKEPMKIDALLARLAKPSAADMRKACNGDTAEGLEGFLKKNHAFFNIAADGLVSAVLLSQIDDDESQRVDSTSKLSSDNSSETSNKSDSKVTSSGTPKASAKLFQPSALRNGGVKTVRPRHPLIEAQKSTDEPSSCSSTNRVSTSDRAEQLAKEGEAVQYFQRCLQRKQEKWVPIRSLAGHQSQATEEIRAVVGNQLDFEKFLLKHPAVFEVQGNLVSLKDRISAGTASPRWATKSGPLSARPRNGGSSSNSTASRQTRSSRPMSLVMLSPQLAAHNTSTEQPTADTRRHSTHLQDHSSISSPADTARTTTAVHAAEGCCIQMMAQEYQTVMHLRKVLDRHDRMLLTRLMDHLADKAPAVVQETIGHTEIELEGFIDLKSDFFELSVERDGQKYVSNRRFTKKMNIVVVDGGGHNPEAPVPRMLTNKCGIVTHVVKLWGIIDLGRHEHVFFDKSIFRNVDDLQKHFCKNDILYFNAILAPKDSRAKWRATQVWRECDRKNLAKIDGPLMVGNGFGGSQNTRDLDHLVGDNTTTRCTSSLGDETEFEGEMDELDLVTSELLHEDRLDELYLDGMNDQLVSGFARQGAYSEAELKFMNDEIMDQMKNLLGDYNPRHFSINEYLTVTNESYFGLEDDLSGSDSQPVNEANNGHVSSTNNCDVPSMVSVGVQTTSTGEIMTINFYHSD